MVNALKHHFIRSLIHKKPWQGLETAARLLDAGSTVGDLEMT